jgi:hypothetical protein
MSRQNLEAIDSDGKQPELSIFALFDRDPKIFYDVGITAVLRQATIDVYRQMRRLAWRSDNRSGDMVLDHLTERGFIISRVTAPRLAERTGLSERHVMRALADLRALGWIQRHNEDARNPMDRKFSIGTFHRGDRRLGNRAVSASAGELYCDIWVEKLYFALLKHGVSKKFLEPGARQMPAFDGVFPFPERSAFAAAYIAKNHPECSLRKDEK